MLSTVSKPSLALQRFTEEIALTIITAESAQTCAMDARFHTLPNNLRTETLHELGDELDNSDGALLRKVLTSD